MKKVNVFMSYLAMPSHLTFLDLNISSHFGEGEDVEKFSEIDTEMSL